MLGVEEFQKRVAASLGGEGLAFPRAEYAARLEATRAAMGAAGLDALFVTHVPDVNYLSGYDTFGVANHVALLVRLRGNPVIQPSTVEIGAALANGVLDDAHCVPCDTWYGQGGIGAQMAALLADLGLAQRRIGLQPARTGLRPDIREALLAAAREADFIDASTLVARLRLVKSSAELEKLDLAAEVTAQGIEAAFAALGIGVADQDLAAAACAAMLRAGGDFPSIQPIVTTGRRTCLSHQTHRRRQIEAGDAVFFEFGGCHSRYTAPLMRSAIMAKAADRYRRVADAVEATLQAVIAAARPGRSCTDVVRDAARAHAGRDDDVFFLRTYGYHVGIGYPPTWAEMIGAIAEGIDEELRPGMVFHLPIAFRLPGEFGIGLSETIRITEEGCVPLGRLPRQPVVEVV